MCLWALLSAGARSLGMGNVEPRRGTGLRVGPRPTSTTGETQPHHGEIITKAQGRSGKGVVVRRELIWRLDHPLGTLIHLNGNP